MMTIISRLTANSLIASPSNAGDKRTLGIPVSFMSDDMSLKSLLSQMFQTGDERNESSTISWYASAILVTPLFTETTINITWSMTSNRSILTSWKIWENLLRIRIRCKMKQQGVTKRNVNKEDTNWRKTHKNNNKQKFRKTQEQQEHSKQNSK